MRWKTTSRTCNSIARRQKIVKSSRTKLYKFILFSTYGCAEHKLLLNKVIAFGEGSKVFG